MATFLSFSEIVEEPRINEDEEAEISSLDEDHEMAENTNDSDCGTDTSKSATEGTGVIGGNPGWADAMAKILKTNKPKNKKTIVLAKAKKLQQVAKKEKPSVETDTAEKEEKDTTVKFEKNAMKDSRKLKKKLWENKGRVQPHILDKNREKALAKIATKGVVQLFNAVRQHQKKLDEQFREVKHSEVKKDKIMKSVDKKAFLDVLMGKGSSAKFEADMKEEEDENKEDSVNQTWKVLQDDFMTGVKLKDWDKNELDLEDDITHK
ncbi:RRP15-like protein [Schistocerca americana]|uniref:RRP15-like protein n=1 Tax=Schistocerca americana TaxID=7009 RepID=UPI001F4FB41B|nr:RRP15-like protein [Schistocerca americana]